MPSPSPAPTITEETGDIFTAPTSSVLLHACNCRGSWGAGVAAAFKSRYPNAYHRYHAHCTNPRSGTKVGEHQKGLLGSCLLIPPCEASTTRKEEKKAKETDKSHAERQEREEAGQESKEDAQNDKLKSKATNGVKEGHWIACLFTSVSYGRGVGTPEDILRATESAVKDLRRQIDEAQRSGDDVGEVWAVRINSGLFNVPWEDTLDVLKKGGVAMTIVRPPDDEKSKDASSANTGRKRSANPDWGRGRAKSERRVRGRGGLEGWLKR